MAEGPLHYELVDGDVAWLRMDDGKANALSHEMFAELGRALDRAEKEAQALVLAGRPGRFSAGFHLPTMQSGRDAAVALMNEGAEWLLRFAELPLPVVAACGGHALAMGALLLLAADLRIGARGDFKLGLNEVAIGLPLPEFAIELARARLSPLHFQRATVLAEIVGPEAACEVGWLDRLVEPAELDARAGEVARGLAGTLSRPALAASKRRARGAMIAQLRENLVRR